MRSIFNGRGPVLGICAGMQALAVIFDSSLVECVEIGMTEIRTASENSLFSGDFEAYELHRFGARPVEIEDCRLVPAEGDRIAPRAFYSTTNHRTLVRSGQQWLVVEGQRMDALVVIREGRAFWRNVLDLSQLPHLRY
jgi:hypothetical protein